MDASESAPSGDTTPPPLSAVAESISPLNESAAGLADELTSWFDSVAWIPSALAQPLTVLVLVAALLLFAWLLYVVVRPLLLRWAHRAVAKTPFEWDDDLFGHGVFRWITHLVPALMIHIVAPGLFESTPGIATALVTFARLYIVVAGYFVVDSLINAGHVFYRRTSFSAKFEIGAFVDVAKLVFVLLALIVAISAVLGRSPAALIGGLGVFASVLMLVFKDVILGFVAGVQLSSNRMLSTGDWIEMPSHSADGTVVEVGLTTVKVQNFDKTITTIPTYSLITQPFKNWRGMQLSEGRRIKRSLLVDVNSIRLCDRSMLARFRQIEHIEDYVRQKEEEVAEVNKKLPRRRSQNRVNGRRLTNVGTFRAYIEAYLRHHPDINQDLTLIVRQLASDGRGLPIEIYCFSARKDWAVYEQIQADIFDHLYAVAPEFDLRLFQEPSGSDIRDAIRPAPETPPPARKRSTGRKTGDAPEPSVEEDTA